MKGVTHFLTTKLKLKVNESKIAVARPWQRKFLGFSFTNGKEPKRRITPKALDRFKERIRALTRRTGGISLARMVENLGSYLAGWRGYFGFCQTPSVLQDLDSWIRRRLRSVAWTQWKHGKRRYAELRAREVDKDLANHTAGSSHGPWRISLSPALSFALPNATWTLMETPFPVALSERHTSRTAVYGPVRTVVWEGRSVRLPPIPIAVRERSGARSQGSRHEERREATDSSRTARDCLPSPRRGERGRG